MPEKVYIGGLMRCCTETLRLRAVADPPAVPPAEGEVYPCKWCSSSMIWEGDGWRWKNEEALKR